MPHLNLDDLDTDDQDDYEDWEFWDDPAQDYEPEDYACPQCFDAPVNYPCPECGRKPRADWTPEDAAFWQGMD